MSTMLRSMEAFQQDGLWWDPRDPTQTWGGAGRFDVRNGAFLTVTLPVERPELSLRFVPTI